VPAGYSMTSTCNPVPITVGNSSCTITNTLGETPPTPTPTPKPCRHHGHWVWMGHPGRGGLWKWFGHWVWVHDDHCPTPDPCPSSNHGDDWFWSGFWNWLEDRCHSRFS
jgi:hypothetical protein